MPARIRSHADRQQRINSARSTLIDALRLVDDGKLDEGLVGCAMAMAFLAPVTDEARVDNLLQGVLLRAVKREQERREMVPIP